MKLPYSWLKDFTDIGVHNVPPRQYAADMTMAGTMVGSWETPGDEIRNVVVGRVLSIIPHPDSDHLVVCQVDVGSETLQIITGAANLHAGDLVPAALDDSTLPGDVVIRTTKMRGLESRGMLCSMGELGLSEHDCPYGITNGILVLPEAMGCKPGDDIRGVLGLDDVIFDFDILHNRPDCLSIIGLARESAATFHKSFSVPAPMVKGGAGDLSELLHVDIQDADLCPRYTAAMAKNIRIQPSPQWMRDRLRNAGIRPINNIVDITNYVMLEYGQPMHAFDYACINGSAITVRRSRPGEHCVTLDGQDRLLQDNTLVIADAEKAVAIAGVMGGENSEITEHTQMIVFESAMFNSVSIRTTSRRLGMRTEASGRFERGVDCEGCLTALQRACQLVEELGAGEIIGGITDAYPVKKPVRVLTLEPEKISAFIGASIPRDFMVNTLKALAFTVDGDKVTVPSWRDDMEGRADLAEEVARYFGYDNIPTTLFAGQTTRGGLTRRQAFARKVSAACISAGYSETNTLSFMSPKAADKLRLSAEDSRRRAVVITNPLGEDQSLMRTTALPAMLEVAARNYNYRAPEIHLFEQSKVYLPKVGSDGVIDPCQLPEERSILVMAAYGDDFFHIKGSIESILTALCIEDCEFEPCTDQPSYHPGRCAVLKRDGQTLGYMGQIHPLVLKNYGVGTELYMAELDLESLFPLVDTGRVYHTLPKYPAVTRDLAIMCDDDLYVLQLERVIRAAAGSALEKLELFDVYRGAQVAPGKKSVAFSLTLRSFDHTLTDGESDEIIRSILEALKTRYNATLRL